MKIQSRNEKSRCESEKENTQLFLESIPVEKKNTSPQLNTTAIISID